MVFQQTRNSACAVNHFWSGQHQAILLRQRHGEYFTSLSLLFHHFECSSSVKKSKMVRLRCLHAFTCIKVWFHFILSTVYVSEWGGGLVLVWTHTSGNDPSVKRGGSMWVSCRRRLFSLVCLYLCASVCVYVRGCVCVCVSGGAAPNQTVPLHSFYLWFPKIHNT